MSLKSALPKGRAVTRVKALETLGSQAFHLSLPAAFVVAQRRRHPQQLLLLPPSSPSSSSHSSSSPPLSSSVSASPSSSSSSSSSSAAAATQSQIHPHPKPAWSRPAVARCPSPPGKKRSLLVAVAGPSGLGPGVFAPPRQTRRLAFHTGASGIGKARTAGGSPPQRFLLKDEAATGEAGRSGDEAATAGVVSVGEDAYFEGDRRDALGVGDGVGGWASTGTPGANAGRFSALLMSAIADEAECEANLPKGPVDIMQAGYERCMLQARSEGLQGSSTALLALLRSAGEQDYLRVASVGDCWLGVVRQVGPHLRRQIVFETQEQQHHFNCPFQLGTNKLSSTPHQHAQDYTFPVEQGDIVVLCSDGLVDNLFENEIIAEINAAPQPLAPQSLSDRLCARAKLASESRAGQRPFGVKAAKAGKLFNGGKVDDISVLVAIIGGSSPPHP